MKKLISKCVAACVVVIATFLFTGVAIAGTDKVMTCNGKQFAPAQADNNTSYYTRGGTKMMLYDVGLTQPGYEFLARASMALNNNGEFRQSLNATTPIVPEVTHAVKNNAVEVKNQAYVYSGDVLVKGGYDDGAGSADFNLNSISPIVQEVTHDSNNDAANSNNQGLSTDQSQAVINSVSIQTNKNLADKESAIQTTTPTATNQAGMLKQTYNQLQTDGGTTPYTDPTSAANATNCNQPVVLSIPSQCDDVG